MPRIPVLILLCCIIVKIASSFFPVRQTQLQDTSLPYQSTIKVVFTCTPQSWYDTVLHILTQASAPVNLRIDVMIQCDRLEEAIVDEGKESHFKGVVRLFHVKNRQKKCPIQHLKRLVQKCVVDTTETVVVYMDSRAKLVKGWDATIMNAYDTGVVLSVPSCSKSGRPQFPTRLRNEEGSVFRGMNRKFKSLRPQTILVPSTCVCTEFCVFPTNTLKQVSHWPSSPVEFTLYLERMGCFVACVNAVVLEHDKRFYSDIVLTDKGCKEATLLKEHRIGLCNGHDDAEKIVKFGSCKVAHLTLRFL